jgi:hypothetical protein
MKFPLLLALFISQIFIFSNLFPQGKSPLPVMQAVKTNVPVELKAMPEDPAWDIAIPVELNYEIKPSDNTKARERTIVKTLYDDKRIYFRFECYDSNPAQIRASLTDRDKMLEDDYVFVIIDTYADNQKAYEFVVNPFGIKADLLATKTTQDASVDYVWQSAGAKNEHGWIGEMAIPFSILSFPNSDEQVWYINAVRNMPRSSKIQNSWIPIDRNIPGLLSQFGLLKGLKNIKQNELIELLPYAMGQKAGAKLNLKDPNSGFKYNDFQGRVGGSVKYSPNANLSVEAVINPDFSQIETDAAQISVNTTFALSYEEKRPFFLTGRDLLQTSMYYSRSINDPLSAMRVMGKSGKLSYLYMSAYDRNTVFILPGEDASNTIGTNLKSLVNIGRIRFDYGNETYLGGMVLCKNLEDGHNYVAGVDWSYKFWENWYFTGEGFISTTKEITDSSLYKSARRYGGSGKTAALDGENYSGQGFDFCLQKKAKYYVMTLTYNDYSPTYQTYNGLFDLTGYRKIDLINEYDFYPDNSFITLGQIGVETYLRFNYDGLKKEQGVEPYLYFEMKGQTNIKATYAALNDEIFNDKMLKNISCLFITATSKPVNEISFSFDGQFGNFVNRTASPEVGEGHKITTSLVVKPSSKINLTLSYSRARLSSKQTDKLFFDGNIYRGVAIYQFTPELFFRIIGQYNTFQNSVQIYPLISYKLNAFTTCFAGMTTDYLDYKNEFGIVRTNQQYFLKAQYLLGI